MTEKCERCGGVIHQLRLATSEILLEWAMRVAPSGSREEEEIATFNLKYLHNRMDERSPDAK